MKTKYDLIVFDLDGTVIDSVIDIMDALNATLKDFDIDFQFCYEGTKGLLGGGALELAKQVLLTVGKDPDSPFFDIFCDQYYIRYEEFQGNSTRLYPGIDDVFKRAIEKGIKLAIFSNKPQRVIIDSISNLTDITKFEFVLGHSDGYAPKPDPTAFNEKCIQHGLDIANMRILYVGDSDVDMIFAKNIRADGCGCAYGYRSRKELVENDATFIIKRPKELLKYIF